MPRASSCSSYFSPTQAGAGEQQKRAQDAELPTNRTVVTSSLTTSAVR